MAAICPRAAIASWPRRSRPGCATGVDYNIRGLREPMRVTYRKANNKDYWTKRWADIPADQPMQNHNAYPLKYAELTVTAKDRPILEAGCGAGRILRYYHGLGH